MGGGAIWPLHEQKILQCDNVAKGHQYQLRASYPRKSWWIEEYKYVRHVYLTLSYGIPPPLPNHPLKQGCSFICHNLFDCQSLSLVTCVPSEDGGLKIFNMALDTSLPKCLSLDNWKFILDVNTISPRIVNAIRLELHASTFAAVFGGSQLM